MVEKEYNVSWPGWNVVDIIGYGSYGRVYEIERDVFGHTEKAALKVISIPENSGEIAELYNDGYDSESITQRFKSHLKEIVREYALMSEMKGHTNIVYCDDLRYIQHDDGIGWDIYIKMELLTPLPKILGNGFSEKLAVKLGLDICNALILCKSKNIVHRDIKPQNIFVSEDKNFKLGDFGIAKTVERTTSGTKTGTYKYMAPEVYNNQPYGHGADIYSLGMVLYWLLNERRTPFLPLPPQVPTATDEERARDTRFAGFPIPEPIHGSEELKRIVLKACAFWPEERYKSAAEMRKDLLTLASNGRYISQSQYIKSTGETESRKRISATDTNETVGNFGRVPKEETESDKTVGVFARNTENERPGKKNGRLILIGSMLFLVVLFLTFIAGSAVSYLRSAANGKEHNTELLVNTQPTAANESTDEPTQVTEAPLAAEPTETAGTSIDETQRAEPSISSVEATETIQMKTVHVWTDNQGNHADTPFHNIREYDDNGYLFCLRDVDGGSSLSARPVIYFIYNRLELMERISILANNMETFSDSEINAEKESIGAELLKEVGGVLNETPSFRLISTDKDGYVLRFIDFADGLGRITIVDYTYDESNKVVQGVSYTNGIKTNYTDLEYNAKGQLIRKNYTDLEYAKQYITEYSYDSLSRILQQKETQISESSAPNVTYRNYRYSDDGRTKTEEFLNSGDGNLVPTSVNTIVTSYDDFGNEIQSVEYIDDKKYGTTQRSYKSILVPENQIQSLCNTYDGIPFVAYSIVDTSGPEESTEFPTVAPTEDPVEIANREQYAHAEELLAAGKEMEAALIFRALGDYQDSAQRSFNIQIQQNPRNTTISAGGATVALKSDGTAIATGGDNSYNQWYVYNWDWKNIVSISAGSYRTLALRADGTVVNAGWSDRGKYGTGKWKDIVAVAAGSVCAVGLKADGTVVATGPNYRGENNVNDWENIVAISAGLDHTVGLKSDGTVVATGDNTFGQCDVSNWTNIVAISAGDIMTAGLKADGTVVSTRYKTNDWTDIISIASGSSHIVGLKVDGTVVSVGSNSYGECDVSDWTDIVAISASTITMGLRSDGTVVAIGGHDSKQRDVDGWSDIRLPEYSGDPTTDEPAMPTTSMTSSTDPIPGYIVCATTVNVRNGPSVQDSLVTTLPNGQAVRIYKQATVMGKSWARIDEGWVCMDYVRLGTVAAGGTGNDTGTTNNAPVIVTTVPAGAIAVGYTNEDVKIRTGSGLGYPEVVTVKKGNYITIYEKKQDGGMSWGLTDGGWVCINYLTITGIGASGSGNSGTIANCDFTANVRSNANSGSTLIAKVKITSRVVVYETMVVGSETWGRTDLGWISMQYIVMDDETAPVPTPTDPRTVTAP